MTNFVNEDCNSTTIRGSLAAIPEEFTTDVTNVTDVASYFSRPKIVVQTQFGTSFNLVAFAVNNQNIQANLTNFSRIKGCLGYRATVCFRAQVVANPFQAGRLRMCFQPFQFQNDHHNRFAAVTPVSQLPGVELDITESTSAILRVPFIHPNNFFGYTPQPNIYTENLGRLDIVSYLPLTIAAGTLQPRISLWMWLEDFEVIGAASSDVVAQSGKFRSNKKDTASLEADAIPGNVSNVLAAGANAVTWLGKKIPMLSSYSGTASWALRGVANFAASYGWAKPISSVVPSKMMNTNNIHQFNCDGADPAFNLGTTTDNSVVPYPGFAGSNVDEMAIAYIVSVYGAIAKSQLNVADIADQVVYSCSLSPSSMFYSGTDQNQGITLPIGRAIWPSTLYALGNLFRYWKGGFKFRVKIAKTKFHTGRLILGFNPRMPKGSSFIDTPLDPSDMQFKSVIWDLREGNVMDFECPYISPFSYLDMTQSYGSFFIAVLDPLQGPDTVSVTVPIIVEVAGMDDFEFSVPMTAKLITAPKNTTYFAQSGSFEPISSTVSDHAAMHCIGEKLLSIKQLLVRAVPRVVMNAGSRTLFNTLTQFPAWSPASGTPTTTIGEDRSYLQYFQSAYTMARGGFVLDVVATRPGTIISAYSAMGDDGTDNFAIVTEERTALHVKMPYFNYRSRHLTMEATTAPQNGVYVLTKNATAGYCAIAYQRAADDFQLGYFIGFPPLARTPLNKSVLSTNIDTTLQLS